VGRFYRNPLEHGSHHAAKHPDSASPPGGAERRLSLRLMGRKRNRDFEMEKFNDDSAKLTAASLLRSNGAGYMVIFHYAHFN
jgi:hypothetical protein